VSEDGPSDSEIKALFAHIGHILGSPETSQEVMSGRLPAEEVLPLLAGMVDSAVQTILMPLTGSKQFIRNYMPPFGNTRTRPMKGTITLLDGSKLRYTLEAVPAPPPK
jgi:hypothetical protein